MTSTTTTDSGTGVLAGEASGAGEAAVRGDDPPRAVIDLLAVFVVGVEPAVRPEGVGMRRWGLAVGTWVVGVPARRERPVLRYITQQAAKKPVWRRRRGCSSPAFRQRWRCCSWRRLRSGCGGCWVKG